MNRQYSRLDRNKCDPGMQTVWKMGNESEILTVPLQEFQGYPEYGGSVYGNKSYDPSPVHFKDKVS
jgi:hypothetical protein